MRYQDVRISRHFVLSDFLCGLSALQSGVCLPAHVSFTDETIENAKYLAESLLEPMIRRLGPLSLGNAWLPEPLATNCNDRTSARFTDAFGAGADVTWHREIAADRAPLNVAKEIDATRAMSYERLFAHGSQIYMAAKRTSPSHIVQEKNKPGSYAFSEKGRDALQARRASAVKPGLLGTDWKGKYRPTQVDWHRCRVSPHFMVTDFAFDETRLARGTGADIAPLRSRAVRWSEVLEPLKRDLGHLSVLYADKQSAVFLLPQDATLPGIEHPYVVNIETKDHPSQTAVVRLTLASDFEPGFKTVFMDGTHRE